MEFYMTDIPGSARPKQIRAALGTVLKRYFIYAFELRQWQSKKFRHIQEGCFTVHDPAIGEEILRRHGTPEPRNVLRGTRFVRLPGKAQTPVIISGSAITIRRSNKNVAVPDHLIRALRDENEKVAKNLANRQPADKKPYRTPFAFMGFECGVWTTDPRNSDLPTFSSFYHSVRPGNFKMTRQAIQVELFKIAGSSAHPVGQYMLCPTSTIRSSIISHESTGTYFIISLRWSPKLYEKLEPTSSPTSPLSGYGSPIPQAPSRRLNKARIPSLDERHAKIVSYCFVYRFKLKEAHEAIRLDTVGSIPGFQDIQNLKIFHQYANYDFQRSMEGLEEQLATLPFDVAFQMHSLVLNGVLLPHRVKELLGVVRRAIQASYNRASQPEANRDSNGIGVDATTHATQVVASVFKSWAGEWEPQLPSDDPATWLSENIQKDFLDALETKQKSQEYMLRMKFYRKENQVLIHRMSITPTGMFPGGPNLEPKNRVLREYHQYLNHFLRVSLVEEDGGDLRFESGVDGKYIYDGRFLPFLMPNSRLLTIAGRTFTFLGFSQSSLRSHTAWFMAPVITPRRTITVERVIELLGNFKSIKIPGKCAARIGQAFTDTVANIKIQEFMTAQKRDIVRIDAGGKKYTFSDGCGTISRPLIEMIWKKGEFNTEPKPTVFQIRFGGAKGVVALDSTLRDPIICLYDSMVKFDGLKNKIFEISRSFTKPLPFYLNRCIIKILEDRGVPVENFMKLQRGALASLRERTFTPDSAAYFLDYQNRCTQANIPFLIRELYSLGWDYKEDNFLRKVVEFTMLSTLRDMKYRARIQVDKGFTLVGILDETGYLREGEIYCPIQRENGEREAHRGVVAICRNPALHPGDIQVVTAIEVPYDSPLRDLTNCVVFSQRGTRDLPSMLSGGDLDGDIYHIWWEPSMMPRFHAPPADFPAVEALNFERDVTQADIGKFFLDFMENDKLGVISIAHMVLADQQPGGVRSEACLTCARMASQAVDFPKTGVPVKMSELPRTTKVRPDFLAPGPGVKFIDGNPNLITDEYEDEFNYEWLDFDTAGQIDVSKFEDADDPFRTGTDFRYYKSDKALGHLFREIDEEKFIKTWEDNAARFERGPNDLLKKVQEYMVKSVDLDVMYGFYVSGFAHDLRISYENNIRDLSHNYAINRNNDALEEVEVFIGCIIGTESHRQSRVVRDSAEEMRGEVTRLISHVAAIIRYGSEGTTAVRDGNYDGLTLERALACVQASFTAREDNEGGSSFGWLAAAVGLKELSKRKVDMSLADSLGGMRF
ncbi:hypothetical protein TWF506_004442 [Arthrobotrys conoides]|uniref:RNA-dependent RNA polymerase n=1 Tax=Arthrobotrys conoides TaxID=74498 RepID=A0AAN8RPC5_9PEZI